MQVQLEEDKTSLNTMIDGKQSEIAQLDASIQEAVAAQKAEEEKRQQEAAQAAAAQEAEEIATSPSREIIPPETKTATADQTEEDPEVHQAEEMHRLCRRRGQTERQLWRMQDNFSEILMYWEVTA